MLPNSVCGFPFRLACLLCFARSREKQIFRNHETTCLSSFQEVIGHEGTVFSPSASMNLCNTDIPFDIDLTPSHQMGAFAEYIRQASSSVRTFHPFWSISGLGKYAEILRNVSRHSYGVGSPWSKFLDLDLLQINIGIHPSKAVTLIHHIEVVTGVPYRYTKEFMNPSNLLLKDEPTNQ